MFERIIVDAKNSFRPGFLCECLLFYKKIILIGDKGSFPKIVRECGLDNLLYLVKQNLLELRISESAIGAGHVKDDIYTISSYGADRAGRKNDVIDAIFSFNGLLGHERYIAGNTLEMILLPFVNGENYLDTLEEEIFHPEHLHSAVKLECAIKKTDILSIETDIKVYKTSEGFFKIKTDYPKDIVTGALIRLNFGTNEIYKANFFNAEVSADRFNIPYLEYRSNKLLLKRHQSNSELLDLNRIEVPGFADIKKTMNSSFRSFSEFLDLLNEARKFKEFLDKESFDNGLMAEYNKMILKHPFSKKISFKILKFIVSDITGTYANSYAPGSKKITKIITGTALDKIASNWTPNLFVRGPYKNFLMHITDLRRLYA